MIGAAEAECMRDEKRWCTADDYAVRSMAQTRAASKALKMPLGFVFAMAGYETTPAEEMPAVVEQPPRPRPAGKDPTLVEERQTAEISGCSRSSTRSTRNGLGRLVSRIRRCAVPQDRQDRGRPGHRRPHGEGSRPEPSFGGGLTAMRERATLAMVYADGLEEAGMEQAARRLRVVAQDVLDLVRQM